MSNAGGNLYLARVNLCTAAAGVDVAGLQTFIAELQQRYAASESSQLEMLSDHLLKVFKDVQLEFNKGLADKPLDRVCGEMVDPNA